MEEEKKQIVIVRGNSKDIAIPLQKETVVQDGVVTEDYIPEKGAEIIVSLKTEYVSFDYTPVVIDGNVLVIHEDGNIPASTYNVEIRIKNPDGTKLRSMWCGVIRVCECNAPLLKEYDNFHVGNETLIASVFYFAKSEKYWLEITPTSTSFAQPFWADIYKILNGERIASHFDLIILVIYTDGLVSRFYPTNIKHFKNGNTFISLHAKAGACELKVTPTGAFTISGTHLW